ncbi:MULTISPECIES: hypothetical protein [Oceanibaculum]|nr:MULTISPECIES: hypothetical protein [Oceanibaculum]MCH2393562.1 hypothetical protein [Oceanibaculum sp.]
MSKDVRDSGRDGMEMTGRHIGQDRRTGRCSGLQPALLSAPAMLSALVVSLLLSACATDAPSGPSLAAAPLQAAGSKGADASASSVKPGLAAGLSGGLAGLLPEPPRPDNMSLAPQAAAPAPDLVGMTAQQLGGLLGQPRYLRREAPAQVWQYTDRRCILDIFLYPEHGEYRVVHVETRDPRSLSALNVGSCLNGLAVLPASLRGS